MPVFLMFPPGKQREFLILVKETLSCPWKKIIAQSGVSRAMFFNYLNETAQLRENVFLSLCGLANVSSGCYVYEKRNVHIQPECILPSQADPQLAQFIGIVLGDGHIDDHNWQIFVTFHGTLEKDYAIGVKSLMRQLFHKEPHQRNMRHSNAIQLRIDSKRAVQFLMSLGIPAGRRTGNPSNKIPSFVLDKEELLKARVRGLFDSEAGFSHRHHHAVRISIYNKCPVLLPSIRDALVKLGYHVQLKHNCVRLGRTSEVISFFETVLPENMYKLLKYRSWRKTGRVPSTADMQSFLTGSGLNQHHTALI